MSLEPQTWIIRKSTLPIIVTLGDDGLFIAEFDALRLRVKGMTYDGAILNVAKAIQSLLEARHVT